MERQEVAPVLGEGEESLDTSDTGEVGESEIDAEPEVAPKVTEPITPAPAPASEVSQTRVKTTAPAGGVPDETERRAAAEREQERAESAAESQRIETEKTELLKLVDDALKRGEAIDELVDSVLPHPPDSEDRLTAEQRRQVTDRISRMMPFLVAQFQAAPPEQHRLLFKRFETMVDSMISDPVEAAEAKNRGAQFFREHGIQVPN